MNPGGIFLDRDGTINEEVDFLSSPNNLHILQGSVEAIREANVLGLKVFIITNQSGIARGFLTENDLQNIHTELLHRLEEYHVRIDAIYYCPHHPELGNPPYNISCTCRKPNIGMLQKAVEQFGVDLKKSFVIGDRMIDIQTGNNAEAISILVLTGYGKEELNLCKNTQVHIDYVASDLHDAIQFVKRTLQQEHAPVSRNQ